MTKVRNRTGGRTECGHLLMHIFPEAAGDDLEAQYQTLPDLLAVPNRSPYGIVGLAPSLGLGVYQEPGGGLSAHLITSYTWPSSPQTKLGSLSPFQLSVEHTAATMKEAIVAPDITVKVIDSPVPEPGPGEVLIRVVVSGTNPKDWKVPVWTDTASNSGDDIAGTVVSLGTNVRGFHEGDRVAAFHVMRTSGGSFAEYAIAPQHTVFAIPESTTFEEAATVPLAAYTAAVALFRVLELPSPWDRAEATNRPLVIYGASTAVGAFAIKLARAAGIHPIIAVGSGNSKFILPTLAEGDKFVDYTAYKTDGELVEAIKKAAVEAGAKDGQIYNVLDSVSTAGTTALLGKVLETSTNQEPKLSIFLPLADPSTVDPKVKVLRTSVGTVHEAAESDQLFGLVWGQAFARGLAEGWLTPHPHELVKGGLDGLEDALKDLKEGRVRAKKMVVRISETEGVKGL
ncbi:hypothetical protein ACJZ2D_004763 [Fusarium nematophilum]